MITKLLTSPAKKTVRLRARLAQSRACSCIAVHSRLSNFKRWPLFLTNSLKTRAYVARLIHLAHDRILPLRAFLTAMCRQYTLLTLYNTKRSKCLSKPGSTSYNVPSLAQFGSMLDAGWKRLTAITNLANDLSYGSSFLPMRNHHRRILGVGVHDMVCSQNCSRPKTRGYNGFDPKSLEPKWLRRGHLGQSWAIFVLDGTSCSGILLPFSVR